MKPPAHVAEKPLTNRDTCRKISCPWHHARAVSSVMLGSSWSEPGGAAGAVEEPTCTSL